VERSLLLLASLGLSCSLYAQNIRRVQPGVTPAAVAPADLRKNLYDFSDDSMLGRKVGADPDLMATRYIERKLRKLGLVTAGDSGTFFQNVPLVSRGLAPGAVVVVDGRRYLPWTDFIPRDQGMNVHAFEGAGVIYTGVPGDSSLSATTDAAGKIVVVRVAHGWQADRANLTKRFPKAAAIAIASLDSIPALYRTLFAIRPIRLNAEAVAPQAAVPAVFYVSRELAQAMLGQSLLTSTVGSSGRIVTGGFHFADSNVPARNVIAVLRGRDLALRSEYVAIGAHADHLGFENHSLDHDSLRAYNTVMRPQGADSPDRPPTADEVNRIHALTNRLHALHHGVRPDSIYNGADDDGSGSIATLAIAANLTKARNKPKRSILFVWHTAEELGDLGSTYFTDHPTVPRDSIVAQLNMDMVGRGGAFDIPGGGPRYLQLIGSRRLSTELGDLVESVNRDTKAGFDFDYRFDASGNPSELYCRSDHYEYARYGIPIVFFTTGLHQDYHQITDEARYIDYAHYARVTELVRNIALRVADLDHRPVIDKARPDPKAACVQ
jgi:hypothetical protein